jgi:hypothetical protein
MLTAVLNNLVYFAATGGFSGEISGVNREQEQDGGS